MLAIFKPTAVGSLTVIIMKFSTIRIQSFFLAVSALFLAAIAGASPLEPEYQHVKRAVAPPKVSLISFTFENEILAGAISLKNIAFEKQVTIIYAIGDSWSESQSFAATYDVAGTGGYETWKFSEEAPGATQFYIKYRVSGQEYYDPLNEGKHLISPASNSTTSSIPSATPIVTKTRIPSTATVQPSSLPPLFATTMPSEIPGETLSSITGDEDSNESAPIPASLVGGIVGGVLGLVAAFVGGFIVWRRRNDKRRDIERREEQMADAASRPAPPGYSPPALEADTGEIRSPAFDPPSREVKYGYSGDPRNAQWPPVAATKAMEADSRELNSGKRMTAVELHELYGSPLEERRQV